MTAMIITGKKRGGPRQMAAYLLDKGENETVTVREVNGFVTKNVKDALAEMWAVADGSKAKDFLYHVSINPRIGATLTQTQWQQAVDTLEKDLNLVGHQRVVIEHIKKGRPVSCRLEQSEPRDRTQQEIIFRPTRMPRHGLAAWLIIQAGADPQQRPILQTRRYRAWQENRH